jgi:NADH:ubiquinone oxidoreductase subunit D
MLDGDWSSDVCSSDLLKIPDLIAAFGTIDVVLGDVDR